MATSENFEFIIRNFELDSDYYSETVGFVVQQSVAGYRINRDKFYAPRFMPMPLNFSFDEELTAQLLWLRCNRKRLFQKILKAIDVFFEAYYNTPAVCPSARVLLQVNAFEILLDLSSRTDFKNKLESLCTYKGEKKYSYYYEKHDPRIKKTVREKERRTLKGIWADRFYVLRNHIIHGRVVKPMDFIFRQHQRHFDIALLFFVMCIKQLINEARTKGRKWQIFYDKITWVSRYDTVRNARIQYFRYESDIFMQRMASFMRKRKSRGR